MDAGIEYQAWVNLGGWVVQDRARHNGGMRSYLGRGGRWVEGSEAQVFKTEKAAQAAYKRYTTKSAKEA